jgi:hypothetical protein
MLLGTDLETEYVCVPLDAGTPLAAVLTDRRGGDPRPVPGHLFLGYRPLLMGLCLPDPPEEVCLTLSPAFTPEATWRGFPTCPQAVGRLHLVRRDALQAGDEEVTLYGGVRGWHRLLHPHQRLAHAALARVSARRRTRADNIALPGNLYDQVRVAYAIPRAIEVAAVGVPGRGNLFPTDLHGPAGETGHVISLRVGGRAGEQVEGRGAVALVRMPASAARTVYALGPSHMRPLRRLDPDLLRSEPSPELGAPVPREALRIRELVVAPPLEVGVHRIFPARVVGETTLDPSATSLAHVHVHAAAWAERRGALPAPLPR